MRALVLIALLSFACTKEVAQNTDAGVAAADAMIAPDATIAPDAADTDAGVEPDATVAPDAAAPDAMINPDASIEMVYVGSGDGNIYRYALDRESGAFTSRGMTSAGANPSFLAFDPSHQHVYAVDERMMNPGVAAFAIDHASGELTFMNRVSSEGRGPTHVSVDRSGHFVLVANYTEGSVTSLPVAADGSLNASVDTEASGTWSHEILTDPSNHFAFVPCKGADYVAQYVFDPVSGALTPNGVATVMSNAGAGPRHMAFHPNGAWAYVINENDSTITSYTFDGATGTLTVLDTISTLPEGFSGMNTCAEVAVHPNGMFAFGSNRGHDSIALFAVDQAAGKLSLVEHTPTGGRTPRHFSLSSDGALLFAANQESNNVELFRVDATSGALTSLGDGIDVPSPAFVALIELVQ